MSAPFSTSGPYGTNVGDVWLGEGSPVQERLDREEPGTKLVHEVLMKDGTRQECVYVTSNAELIERAREGTVRYWEQKASEN